MIGAGMTNPARDNQAGFTLIEMMVALAVFSVMATMAYAGLFSIMNARRIIPQAFDQTHTLQIAMWRLNGDITQAVDRPVRDEYGDSQPAVFGTPDAGLKITRRGWRNPLKHKRSTLQRVHYFVNSESELVRNTWPTLDRAPGTKPVKQVLLHGVQTLTWRYLSDDEQWHKQWPSSAYGMRAQHYSRDADDQPLPRAIELQVETKEAGHIRLLFLVAGGGQSGSGG